MSLARRDRDALLSEMFPRSVFDWPLRILDAPRALAEDEIRVSVYEREEGSWRYRTLQDVDAKVDFAAARASLALAEIYEGTTVAEAAKGRGG